MAWPVKTLVQRIDAIENAYARYIAKDEMPLSEQKARSRILAYEINAMETYIQYMSKQMVPTTAEKEYLEYHCAAILKQIAKLKSPQFLMLVFGLLAFAVALIEPSVRVKFLDIVGAICLRVQW